MSASCALANAANITATRSKPIAALARAMSGVRAPSRNLSFLGKRSSAGLSVKVSSPSRTRCPTQALMHLQCWGSGEVTRGTTTTPLSDKGHIEASADHRSASEAPSPRACGGTPHGKHRTQTMTRPIMNRLILTADWMYGHWNTCGAPILPTLL